LEFGDSRCCSWLHLQKFHVKDECGIGWDSIRKLRTILQLRSLNVQSDTKKQELLKNPTKIEEIQEKKFIDRK